MNHWRRIVVFALLFVLIFTSLAFPANHASAQVCPDGYGQLKYIASHGAKTGFFDSSHKYASTDYCYTPATNPGEVTNVNGEPRSVKNMGYYNPFLVDVYVCNIYTLWNWNICALGHYEKIPLVPYQ